MTTGPRLAQGGSARRASWRGVSYAVGFLWLATLSGDGLVAQSQAATTAGTPLANRAGLVTLLAGWSEAWSDQRSEDYLGYYSTRFIAAGQQDFAAWQQQRRQKLRRPQFIEVAVAILDIEVISSDRANLRFLQRYRSDRYRDVVTKRLELVREGEDWKILRETVEEE